MHAMHRFCPSFPPSKSRPAEEKKQHHHPLRTTNLFLPGTGAWLAGTGFFWARGGGWLWPNDAQFVSDGGRHRVIIGPQNDGAGPFVRSCVVLQNPLKKDGHVCPFFPFLFPADSGSFDEVLFPFDLFPAPADDKEKVKPNGSGLLPACRCWNLIQKNWEQQPAQNPTITRAAGQSMPFSRSPIYLKNLSFMFDIHVTSSPETGQCSVYFIDESIMKLKGRIMRLSFFIVHACRSTERLPKTRFCLGEGEKVSASLQVLVAPLPNSLAPQSFYVGQASNSQRKAAAFGE